MMPAPLDPHQHPSANSFQREFPDTAWWRASILGMLRLRPQSLRSLGLRSAKPGLELLKRSERPHAAVEERPRRMVEERLHAVVEERPFRAA